MTCARNCTGSASARSGFSNQTTRRATCSNSGVAGKVLTARARCRAGRAGSAPARHGRRGKSACGSQAAPSQPRRGREFRGRGLPGRRRCARRNRHLEKSHTGCIYRFVRKATKMKRPAPTATAIRNRRRLGPPPKAIRNTKSRAKVEM
jgi:hypothetical protein